MEYRHTGLYIVQAVRSGRGQKSLFLTSSIRGAILTEKEPSLSFLPPCCSPLTWLLPGMNCSRIKRGLLWERKASMVLVPDQLSSVVRILEFAQREQNSYSCSQCNFCSAICNKHNRLYRVVNIKWGVHSTLDESYCVKLLKYRTMACTYFYITSKQQLLVFNVTYCNSSQDSFFSFFL